MPSTSVVAAAGRDGRLGRRGGRRCGRGYGGRGRAPGPAPGPERGRVPVLGPDVVGTGVALGEVGAGVGVGTFSLGSPPLAGSFTATTALRSSNSSPGGAGAAAVVRVCVPLRRPRPRRPRRRARSPGEGHERERDTEGDVGWAHDGVLGQRWSVSPPWAGSVWVGAGCSSGRSALMEWPRWARSVWAGRMAGPSSAPCSRPRGGGPTGCGARVPPAGCGPRRGRSRARPRGGRPRPRRPRPSRSPAGGRAARR